MPRLAASLAFLAITSLLVVGCASGDEDASTTTKPPVQQRDESQIGAPELPPLEFSPAEGEAQAVTADIPDTALFDLDSADLKAQADEVVIQISARLDASPAYVKVDGYTDGVGEEAYNLRLSEQRAKALADRISASSSALAVSFCGYGEAGSDGSSADPSLRRVVITLSADASAGC